MYDAMIAELLDQCLDLDDDLPCLLAQVICLTGQNADTSPLDLSA